ncbi:TRAP transporter large permease subunit [Aquabacterium sp.]|uniref:TRAP transporter large permease subunit n=1 Tax=Aquabacterium sp. TaxID=1872578 RepID=UPI0035B0470A
MNKASRTYLGRTLGEWFSSLPIFSLLLLTLIIGTGEMVHGQLLRLGESMFGDTAHGVQYFMLRADPTAPACNPKIDIDAEVQRQLSQTKPAGGDDVDALFGDVKQDPEVLRKSLVSSTAECQFKHDVYQRIVSHMTPQVKAYRTVETSFFALFQLGTENRTLMLLLLVGIAAITTTLGHHHICIRPPHFKKDFKLQAVVMSIASAFLLYSSVRYYQISKGSGLEVEHPVIYFLWMILFGTLLLINVVRIFGRSGAPADAPEGSWQHALLAVPLFSQLALVSGIYFFAHGHESGLAIQVNRLLDLPVIFLNLALFIWSGMLLKQSRIVDLFMNVVRPWRFSPELLTYIVLLAAALPTAYTGASGILVIAAGGIVYHEIRAVGGSRQFALAATAMSGSLGVVLRPCLLVVLIAAYNKQVTTNMLYHWGGYVFLLTSTLFFLASQLQRTKRASIEAPAKAIPQMLRQAVHTLPYVAIVLAVIAVYEFGFDTKLNEVTAPTIMPVIMLAVLVFDKWTTSRRKHVGKHPHHPIHGIDRQDGVEASVRAATNEAIGHIGALIMLMTISLAVGGVVERSDVMEMAPKTFPNIWLAMAFLVVTKVILGIFMDPFGAIILVSGTMAPIAYSNGIDPVHFWMMVLVAFELGYLMPPVALNQLLTRQVIGEEEILKADHEVRGQSFFRRYERWILPSTVMAAGLSIVAFGPLAVQRFEVLAPIKHFFAP